MFRHQKALFVGDIQAAQEILEKTNPGQMKKVGRSLRMDRTMLKKWVFSLFLAYFYLFWLDRPIFAYLGLFWPVSGQFLANFWPILAFFGPFWPTSGLFLTFQLERQVVKSLEVMHRACYEKFAQNAELRLFLFRTHGMTLAEAAPNDRIWGIGEGF